MHGCIQPLSKRDTRPLSRGRRGATATVRNHRQFDFRFGTDYFQVSARSSPVLLSAMFQLAFTMAPDMKKIPSSVVAFFRDAAVTPRTSRVSAQISRSGMCTRFTSALRPLVLLFLTSTGTTTLAGNLTNAEWWRATDDMRALFLETTIGPVPRTIKQIPSLASAWPRGGLYVIPAKRLGDGLVAYTTFGLTNPDMPASARTGEGGTNAILRPDAPADPQPAQVAGYGYELVVLAAKDQPWALNILQWAVNAEVRRNLGLLARVDHEDGFLQRIDIGIGSPVTVLFARARPPLPPSGRLVGVGFALLVATVVTEDEAAWALTNGPASLLDKLHSAGVGQASVPGRASIVH